MKKLIKLIGIATLSLSTYSATLNWSPNPVGEGVKEYRVFLVNGSNTNMVNVGTNIQHNLTNLLAGANYSLFVTAFGTNGLESVPSAVLSYQHVDGPPSSPILLSSGLVLTNNNQWLIGMTWAANPVADAVTGYYVSITQGQNTLTNHFTISLAANFLIQRKNNTRIYLQATNRIGLSTERPVMTLNQPGQVKNVILELP